MPTIIGFYDHKAKLEAASAEIPPDLLTLHAGAFQIDGFQADTFDVDRVADFEARMQSLYVGWDERSRTWVGPTDVDQPMLNRSIEGVERSGSDREPTGQGCLMLLARCIHHFHLNSSTPSGGDYDKEALWQ